MEKFLNRVWATLASGITNVATSIPLTTGHGARFGTIAAGDKIRAVIIDAANNVEVIYITAISTDTLTVLRGQDGSTARAYSAGDRIEARIGKSTMEHLVQQSGEQTFAVAGGTADAMTAAFSPTLTELKDGQPLRVRAVGANTVTNPTLNPDTLGALTIYKTGGVALAVGDIVGAGHELQLTYRASPARLELDNPGLSAGSVATLIHGATAKTTMSNADEFSFWDSVASAFKKITYQNLFTGILSSIVNTVNNWTKSQAGAITTLTDAATIAVDLSLSNNFKVTLAGNRTLGNPTNIVAGQSGVIAVTQDATGSRTLAYSSYYKFAGGTAPALSTAANSVDYLSYYVETTTRILIAAAKDIK